MLGDEEIIRMLMSETTRRRAFDIIVRTYGECLYWKRQRAGFPGMGYSDRRAGG